MKTAKILAWLAALALISNVDGHSRLIEILTDTIADLSAMLTECHEAKEKEQDGVEQVGVMKSITCEDGLASLSCPRGTKMHIHNANYGRLVPGKELCPYPSIHDLNCRTANSMSKVSATCENKGSCSVMASNSVFGDPCDGTYKYLEVHYSCE